MYARIESNSFNRSKNIREASQGHLVGKQFSSIAQKNSMSFQDFNGNSTYSRFFWNSRIFQDCGKPVLKFLKVVSNSCKMEHFNFWVITMGYFGSLCFILVYFS